MNYLRPCYLASLIVVLADPLFGQPAWFNATQYPMVGTPNAIAAGDFNGDGVLDLVTAGCDNTSNIYVLLGKKDGTFQAAAPVDLGQVVCSYSIAVGDVNGDGKLDIVVDISTTSVLLLIGRGDGTFTGPTPVLPQRLQAAYVTLTDLNGDGTLDLIGAVNGPSGGSILICTGKGDGTFSLVETDPIAGVQSQIVVADFNGDRLPDLAVNSPNGTLSILLRNPITTSPMFRPAVQLPVGRTVDSADFAAGDFNHDGFTDLAIPLANPDRLAILLSKGDGTFQRSDIAGVAGIPSSPSSSMDPAIAVGDFNRDGFLDIIADDETNTNAGKLLLLGNGDGTFQSPIVLGFPPGDYRGTSRQIIVGDFNKDGQLDFATADSAYYSAKSSYGALTTWLNTASFPTVTSVVSAASNQPILAPGALATLYGANLTGLATVLDNGVASVTWYDGTYNFGPIMPAPNQPALHNWTLAMAFTVPSSSDLVFIGGAAVMVTNSGTRAVTLSLNVDAGGLPGSIIESMILSGAPSWQFPSDKSQKIPTTPFTSKTNPVLMAGHQYWLVASLPINAYSFASWVTGAAEDLGSYAVSEDGGAWTLYTDAQMGAFSVLGYFKSGVKAVTTPLPSTLGGAAIVVGGHSAPILFASSSQVNFQVPYETPAGTTNASIMANSLFTNTKLTVNSTAPEVFVYGNNWSITENQDYSLNSASNPAKVGSYITVYGTGGGLTTPAITTGAAAPASPLSKIAAPVTASINGVPANVVFAGLTPGNVGLLQVDIQVPPMPSGTYPIQIQVGGAASADTLLAVVQ